MFESDSIVCGIRERDALHSKELATKFDVIYLWGIELEGKVGLGTSTGVANMGPEQQWRLEVTWEVGDK